MLGGVDCDDKMLRLWATNTKASAVCAKIGQDGGIAWPDAAEDVFIHLSPPCTALSKARAGSATKEEITHGINMLTFALDLVVKKGYLNFSLENVSTVNSRAIAQDYKDRYPSLFDYHTFDCADFCVPQSRVRLIISTPETIKLLRETPVVRQTVAEAFAQAGVTLPATHLRSNTNNRDGTALTRSVHQQSFVTTASHPLTWCDHTGQSVRCVNVAETQVLMGFPSSWKLPKGSRLGIHALGNAVPPPLAKAIMSCAVEAARARTAATALTPNMPQEDAASVSSHHSRACKRPSSALSDEAPVSSSHSHVRKRDVSYAKYRSLKRRVQALEYALDAAHASIDEAPIVTSASS